MALSMSSSRAWRERCLVHHALSPAVQKSRRREGGRRVMKVIATRIAGGAPHCQAMVCDWLYPVDPRRCRRAAMLRPWPCAWVGGAQRSVIAGGVRSWSRASCVTRNFLPAGSLVVLRRGGNRRLSRQGVLLAAYRGWALVTTPPS